MPALTEPSFDATETPPSPRRWLPWTAGGAGVVVVALVVSVVFLTGGHQGGHPAPSETVGNGGNGGTGGATFAFAGADVITVRVSKKVAAPDVSDATNQIRTLLSRLYDQGVVAQATRPTAPPASFWDAFAPAIRQQAQADSRAFTLGSTAGSLQALDVSSSRLTIRFLIDGNGNVASVVASASIHGTGQVAGSGPVDLVATGSFLFQSISGAWLITGYPSAAVTVASPGAPPPTNGGGSSPTGSASAGPSGSASP
jgi:hypothetical protein